MLDTPVDRSLEATLRNSPLHARTNNTWTAYATAFERARTAPPEEQEEADAEVQQAWQCHREAADAYWESFYRHLTAAAPAPAKVPCLAQSRPRHLAKVRAC
jgi:hypothetical protein